MKQGLPYKLVNQRAKKELKYASSCFYSLILNIEAVYRRYANQKGFARWGGELFLKIHDRIWESESLYTDKFVPCMEGIQCEDDVSRKIYEVTVSMYMRMRGKYMVKSEKGRQKRVENANFTTRQMVNVAHECAKAKVGGNLALPPQDAWEDIDTEMAAIAHGVA